MKRILTATLILSLVALVGVLAVYFLFIACPVIPVSTPSNRTSTSAPPSQPTKPTPAQTPAETRLAVEFNGEGLNEKLLCVNVGVAGAGNVNVASRIVGAARWVVVLAAGMGKHASLDGSWTMNDFPELAAAGFQDAPPPIWSRARTWR